MPVPAKRPVVVARTSQSEPSAAPIGTLERGLSILQCFKKSPDAAIPDVAEALGLSRSTTYRIAERLRELGFLEVSAATGRWRLGREAVQLGVVALQSTDVMQVAPELLHALLEIAGEAVNLAVFDSDSMILLLREQGPQSVTISSRLGSHRPMHASSLGKAFLAAMQPAERRVLLGRLELKRYTPSTITSATALDREIVKIKADGYALDRSEFEATLSCAAAAVSDHRGLPVASISISGPVERMTPQLERMGLLVADTARAISQRLGHVERASP